MAETRTTPTTLAKAEEPRKLTRALHPIEMMERMFDDLYGRGWLRPLRMAEMADLPAGWEGRGPRFDIVDRDTEVLVRVEVPGVNKEDLEVSIDGDQFTVKGKTRHEQKEEKGEYFRSEVVQGSFTRTVTLPAMVQEGEARAALKDGMLEVTLPKAAPATKRAIRIE